ncbi:MULTISPECIES: MBOAT family protein [Pandoraea]|uniref:Probable alginate O-acetylase AlgI n=1 Tax=Pandoraea communis TaxID=2508297 RepID=A0A5E4WVI1_9BURK|nr:MULTISPECIES: MBOAT family protein [Pandoraea]EON12449.1 membrane bound O-acyl transferase [Pandoraea sp. SD6-2]VVE26916.1 membrane bound O-acyl transferase [Pandoraea communis]
MVFSSIAFLGLFLPITLAAYFLTPRPWRNFTLALASIVFYAWGEPRFLILMIVSIGINFRLAIGIDRAKNRRRMVGWGVAINLFVLGVFKYAAFIVDNLNAVLSPLGVAPLVLRPLPLPIGISFYTFHAISYLVDIYRRNAQPNRSIVDYCLYITLFPQLVAGPIIRYKDIQSQLRARVARLDDVSAGALRFTMGLAKKVLIANQLAIVADAGFNVPPGELSASVAWFSLLCYTLQIYFDFSGYSDMAIGLARMFGFRFPENFNYPYAAKSMQDFWRRWHISLSTWFRDYVYIPLGGNKDGARRTLCNLWIVFLLTGFWHGATWNFLLWGAAHGTLLTLEKIVPSNVVSRSGVWRWARHGYVVLAVMLTWVLFRSDTTTHALNYFGALVGMPTATEPSVTVSMLFSTHLGWLIPTAVMLAAGFYPWALERFAPVRDWLVARSVDGFVAAAFVAPALIFAAMSIALGQYNPFIYFRF